MGTVKDSPTLLSMLALAYGIVAAAAPLLQVRRIMIRQSAADLSLAWMALYAGGCVVWLLYGISIASSPLIVSQALALVAIGIALAASMRFRDAHAPAARTPAVSAPGQRPTPRAPDDARPGRAVQAPRVEDVMSGDVVTVSSQITVEEATRRLSDAHDHVAFAVIDGAGHAVKALEWEDILRVPRGERPARLVAEVRGHGVLVEGSAEVDEVLARPALARVDTAIVVDARRDPIGVLDLDGARHTAPAPRRHQPTARAPSGVTTRS